MKNVVPGENQHIPNDIETSWSTFQGNATLLDQNTHRCEYSQALLIQNHQIVPPNCNINGTKPGHRAQEHLFVLKSIMAFYMQYDMAMILQLWDI